MTRIKQLIADKCVEISQVKNEYGKRGLGDKAHMEKTIQEYVR